MFAYQNKPMLRIFIFALAILFSCKIQAQSIQLTGLVKDTVEKKPLEKASVLLISRSDSSIHSFVRTDKQGKFSLDAPSGKSFTVFVSYPKYADWYDDIDLPSSGTKDLGTISLNTKAYVLKEIVIRNTSPIRMKGDTTEYIADSFKVSPNADVQELLRKMPGIQVNAKGEITAQGEKVKKIYVDGEEFFSDDPAVVTKSLRADAIQHVQVYDKKSDQAAFTGIEDGQREKTINLKLKESAKNGFFGKIEAGSSLAKYNVGKLMGNLFKGKQKISAYVTTNNSEFEGLNWGENRAYGDGGNTVTEVSENGAVMITSFSDEDYQENKGLPNQQTAGAFYGNKWNTFSTGNSAQYQKVKMNILHNGFTNTILPDFTLNNTFNEAQDQRRKRIKFGTKNEWGTDSTGLFKFNFNASQTERNSSSQYQASTYKNDDILLNSTDQKKYNEDQENQLSALLSYRQKLSKKGRSISSDINWTKSDKSSSGSLFATNIYSGNANLKETIDQLKAGKQQSASIGANIVYTEPISKKSFLLVKYSLLAANNKAEQNTNSKSGSGNYDNLVDSLSNNFSFNTYSSSGSLVYRYNAKKITFSIGSGLGKVNYQSNDLEKQNKRSIYFTNFLPTVSFTYKPKAQRNINIEYTGKTENPNLNQIQPLINNNNPLSLQIGNPNLIQGFRNNVNFRFNDYKVLKSKSIYANGSFSNVINAISNSSYIDAAGKNVSQFVNVNGNYNYDLYLSHSRDILKGVNVGIGLQQYGGKNVNIVNNLKNNTIYSSLRLSFDYGYWGDKWFNFYGSFRVGNTRSRSSLRPDFTTAYRNIDGYTSVVLKFKKIKTNVGLWSDFTYYGAGNEFSSPISKFIFTPNITKTFGKSDMLEARISVFDLFNQNRDINRNISSNFLSQSTYNAIRRYVMFTVALNLKNKSAVAESAK